MNILGDSLQLVLLSIGTYVSNSGRTREANPGHFVAHGRSFPSQLAVAFAVASALAIFLQQPIFGRLRKIEPANCKPAPGFMVRRSSKQRMNTNMKQAAPLS